LAAVCDPIDDPELYMRAAEESGIKIRYVVDTHVTPTIFPEVANWPR
jgi:hypothetical protein